MPLYRTLRLMAATFMLAPCAFAEYSDDPYAEVLQMYVDGDGLVDYAALKSKPASLNSYLEGVAELDASVYDAWDEGSKIAFWLNVYNAYTLQAIINHYPLTERWRTTLLHPKNSIRQISGVWDEMTWPVMGKELTLDHIEHKILRVEYDEPRIHAALVCAAKSCPPLRQHPYRGDVLDSQLRDQMQRWMRSGRVKIDKESRQIHLSKIFNWFPEDFVGYKGSENFDSFDEAYRGPLAALAEYCDPKYEPFVRAGDYKVRFHGYDWTLNDQATVK